MIKVIMMVIIMIIIITTVTAMITVMLITVMMIIINGRYLCFLHSPKVCQADHSYPLRGHTKGTVEEWCNMTRFITCSTCRWESSRRTIMQPGERNRRPSYGSRRHELRPKQMLHNVASMGWGNPPCWHSGRSLWVYFGLHIHQDFATPLPKRERI